MHIFDSITVTIEGNILPVDVTLLLKINVLCHIELVVNFDDGS